MKIAFSGGVTGGKLVVHNKYRLGEDVADWVEVNVLRKEVVALKVKVEKYDRYQRYKKAYVNLTTNIIEWS